MDDFILKNLKVVFTEEGSLHILGNCVEALLGAVFLDGGLDEADKLFARLVFPEEVYIHSLLFGIAFHLDIVRNSSTK